ncbi:MAG: L-seryl-tRNA(Sec) selenium transferase [candidate division WOR-3 bacterium]|nr:L-seryl-tRNA(Sec) selenium transferase [candidate division WOR-3 bacterium]
MRGQGSGEVRSQKLEARSQSADSGFRALPSVDKLLESEELKPVLEHLHRRMAVRAIRVYLDELRQKIQAGESAAFAQDELVRRLERERKPTLTRAINGLGVILHTGLGRAPLAKAAQEALADVSEHFSSLEIDLETGRRGSRYRHIEPLLCELTGAEAAMVVNNNCAATMLILSSMARGKEVIVSRGQLIEIGGAFRIPDVMQQSGCKMVEVGTTNRTHLRDYKNALTPETALLLRVHTSNYKITGFTKEVSLDELVALARESKVLVVDDLGSGALVDLSKYGLPKEPLVQDSVKAGADVICFSGDKLIAASQAGIIVGKKKHIDLLKKHPLTRALRCGKLTYAVLERTLELFLDEERLVKEHALFQLLLKTPVQMQREARNLVRRVQADLQDRAGFTVKPALSEIGGGSLATESLESRVVAIRPKTMHVDELARRMRLHRPPVFGRVERGEYVLDFRTIRRDEIPIIAAALLSVFHQ